jgi:hypothetical protein
MAIQGGNVVWSIDGNAEPLKRALHSASDSVRKSMRDVGASMVKIGAGMTAAGAAITGSLTLAVKGWMAYGDELAKASDRTGISVESLARLKHAADQSGIGLGTVESALKRMSRAVDEARQGTGTYVEAFQRLGITMDMFEGKNPEEQFLILADALYRMEDHTTKAALAQELFGRGGLELLPMLKDGASGIQALGEEAERLGLVMDEETARSAEALTDAFARLSKAVGAIMWSIGGALGPTLEKVAAWLEKVVTRVVEWVRNNEGLVSGVTLVVAGIGALLTVLGPIVGALGVFLIIMAKVSVVALGVAAGVGVWAAGAFVLLRHKIADVVGWARANWDRLVALFTAGAQVLGNLMKALLHFWEAILIAVGAVYLTFLGESDRFWGDLTGGAKDGGGDWLDQLTRLAELTERATRWMAENMGQFAETVRGYWNAIAFAAKLTFVVWDQTMGNMIRLIKYLGSALQWLFEQAMRAMEALGMVGGANARGRAVSGVSRASVGGGGGGAITNNVGGLTVNLTTPPGADGRSIAQAVARELPRVLGEELRLRAGQRGMAWGV